MKNLKPHQMNTTIRNKVLSRIVLPLIAAFTIMTLPALAAITQGGMDAGDPDRALCDQPSGSSANGLSHADTLSQQCKLYWIHNAASGVHLNYVDFSCMPCITGKPFHSLSDAVGFSTLAFTFTDQDGNTISGGDEDRFFVDPGTSTAHVQIPTSAPTLFYNTGTGAELDSTGTAVGAATRADGNTAVAGSASDQADLCVLFKGEDEVKAVGEDNTIYTVSVNNATNYTVAAADSTATTTLGAVLSADIAANQYSKMINWTGCNGASACDPTADAGGNYGITSVTATYSFELKEVAYVDNAATAKTNTSCTIN
jgi:hypothetical protein